MPQRSTRHGGQGGTAWRIWQVVDVPVATQRNSQELAATAITQQMAEKGKRGTTNEEKSVANCRRDQGEEEEEEKDEIEEETEVEG